MVVSPFTGCKKQKPWNKTCERYMPVRRRQNLAETDRGLRATCRCVLLAYVLSCQGALLAHVLTCQRFLCAFMLTCQPLKRAHVLPFHACPRAHVPTCLEYSLALCSIFPRLLSSPLHFLTLLASFELVNCENLKVKTL